MDEKPCTPQVLSSPISSICAVISNYWSLIEVHVEYSPSLSRFSRQMNTRHLPITQSDTPGDPTCHLNLPLQPYSFFSSKTPSVWENSWHLLMSDWPRTGSPPLLHLTGYLFMLFSGQWNHVLYGTMLQISIGGFLRCFLTPLNWKLSPRDQKCRECFSCLVHLIHLPISTHRLLLGIQKNPPKSSLRLHVKIVFHSL